jgi:hypothetical protein
MSRVFDDRVAKDHDPLLELLLAPISDVLAIGAAATAIGDLDLDLLKRYMDFEWKMADDVAQELFEILAELNLQWSRLPGARTGPGPLVCRSSRPRLLCAVNAGWVVGARERVPADPG